MDHEQLSTESLGISDLKAYFPFLSLGAIPHAPRRHARRTSTTKKLALVKRAIDVCLVVLALPVLAPLFAMVAILVKAGSPGPLFFSHRRICKSGGFFSMWKFRTMCVNSAEVLEAHIANDAEARREWNLTHKLRNDPRIAPYGRFLRKYSLDEFPQIYNVLNGTMSLVGPRPITAMEVEKYGDVFDSYIQVKPGLTGLWQVSGRSSLSYQARVALDSEYVGTWSLKLDLMILIRTLTSLINTDGAF